MNTVTINRKQLIQAIQVASKAAQAKTNIAVLKCVNIAVTHDTVTVSGTDLTTYIQSTFEIESNEIFNVNIEPKILLAFLNAIKTTTIELAHNSSVNRVAVAQVNDDEFPLMPALPDATIIHCDNFKTSINQVKRAISTDGSRPTLCGILIDMKPEGIKFVASDTYRLHAVVPSYSACELGYAQYVLPAGTIKAIYSMLAEDVTLNLTGYNTQLSYQYKGQDVKITTVNERGTYVKYERIIPEECAFSVPIDRVFLEETLQQVKLFTEKPYHEVVVTYDFENYLVSLQAKKLASSIRSHVINCERPINSYYQFACNVNYLIDLVESLPSEVNVVTFAHNVSNLRTILVKESKFLGLVMPCRF